MEEKIKSKVINKIEYSLCFNTSINSHLIYAYDETKDEDRRAHLYKEIASIRDREEAIKIFDNI